MIELVDVEVQFPRHESPVLRNVGLRVAPGERVLIVGPSGSGKSTLLQVISGNIPNGVNARFTGTVRIGELDQDSAVVDRAASIGVVGQDPFASVCLPDVDAEVALPLENAAVPPPLIRGRVNEALEAADALELAGRPTSSLSGGELQRVALAAAVVGRAPVLLLDEPTSMLDSRGVAAVRRAIDTAVGGHRPAVVLVEHRLDELAGDIGATGLPERTVALGAGGEILMDGPTPQVLSVNAPLLHELGCWLPVDCELSAITGRSGRLEEGDFDGFLASCVPDASEGEADRRIPGDVVLSASGLVAGRPGDPVVGGIDLTLRCGEIVAVLGANGTGKSTLIRTLAGLIPPLAGRVEGERPGLVSQNPEHQFVGRTATRELAYGLDPRRATDARVAVQLAEFRLDHLAEQHPHQLSGGEKRRLSLAAMLAHGRRAVLADEPTLGLDRRDTEAVAQIFRRTAASGNAVLFASHDLRHIAGLADRVLIIAGGGVAFDGDLLTALGEPATLRAAGIRPSRLLRRLAEQCATAAQLRHAVAALGRAGVSGT